MKWKNFNNSYSNQIEFLKTKTPYEILGVNRSSTQDEIKKAYRNKIKLYHPDGRDVFMSKYCEEVTKLINLAKDQILKEIL